MYNVLLLCFATLFCTIVSCSSPHGKPAALPIEDSIPLAYDRKGPSLADTNLLYEITDSGKILKEELEQSILFYINRNLSPAWYHDGNLREHAGFLLRFVEQAPLEGISDSFPLLVEMEERMNQVVAGDSLTPVDTRLEAQLTLAFFWYSNRAWKGLPENKTRAMGWFLPRYHTHAGEWLDSALQVKPEGKLLAGAVFRQYYSLRDYLLRYDSLEKAGGWPMVSVQKKKYSAGDSDSVVFLLRKSLFLHGDLDSDNGSMLFDSVLTEGVVRFQKRHGLKDDGEAGPGFFRELNIPVEERKRTILLNMERSRWMPTSYPPEYLIVNIPEFSLYAYDSGKQVWSMEVVVGKELHETVTFSGILRHVVFNPYWVIPSGILYKETLPGILKSPSYLKKHRLEVVDRNGNKVQINSIDWNRYAKGGFPYVIRQLPGSANSLGRVKFLFPNSYSIYLHDTPSRSLFKEEKRAFSHGCIRVSDPERLADYLLAPQGWSPDDVALALKPGMERWVNLKKTVPVHVVYFTAWVGNDKSLHFRPDVYGRDKRLLQEMLEQSDATLP